MDERGERPAGEKIARRKILVLLTTFLGGLVAASLAAVATGFSLSPLFRKKDEIWVDVGGAGEFPKDRPTRVEFVVRRRDAWVTTESRASAWVVTHDGREFTVYDPRCTHLGCPYRWDDAQKRFLCPCHSAVFASNGAVVSGPAPRPLDRYAVRVASGRVQVRPTVEKRA